MKNLVNKFLLLTSFVGIFSIYSAKEKMLTEKDIFIPIHFMNQKKIYC